jgi:4-amino-4-deoxy-L-arabinose transferase-like glycosyltransferase
VLDEGVTRHSRRRVLDALDLRAFAAEHWRVLLLGALVLVGAAARLVDIVNNPHGFFTDEASFGLNADLILHTLRDEHGGFLPFLFRSFGEYKLPAFIYAEVPFMAIFGRSEAAVRVTSAVLGSLTIATTYLMAKELFRRELPALAAAACLAILPWHVHYSRTGLGDIVTWPLFFTAATYLFLRAVRDPRFLIPAAIAYGLTFYTYRASWVVLPPLLLILASVYWDELWEHRERALAALLLFSVLLLPIARHLLLGPEDRASQAWIFNLQTDQGLPDLFWHFYRSYFSVSFLFQHGDNWAITRHYLPGQGELYWAQLPLILLGGAAMLWRFNRRHLIVFALLLLYPLSGALSDTSPISSRTILGSVTFALLTGYGVWALVALLSWLQPRRSGLIAGGVLATVFVAGAYSYTAYAEHYFSDYPRLSAGYWGWQDGPQQIIAHFLKVQDDYDQLIMDGDFNSPEIFFRFYAGDACRKCVIGGLDRYNPNKRQLFALRPENVDAAHYAYRVLDSLSYPDGSPSFLFIEVLNRRADSLTPP